MCASVANIMLYKHYLDLIYDVFVSPRGIPSSCRRPSLELEMVGLPHQRYERLGLFLFVLVSVSVKSTETRRTIGQSLTVAMCTISSLNSAQFCLAVLIGAELAIS